MNLDFLEPNVIRQKIEVSLPIYTVDVSDEIDVDLVIEKIRNLKKLYPETTTTNVITKNGWRSPYIFKYQPELQNFLEVISCIQKTLKKINSFEVNLINLWTVIYQNEDSSQSHNHYTIWDNLAYNTVLYLTDSKTPIIFETTDSKFEVYPKKGMLLIMHPLTIHSVPEVKDESERIVLVCNFGI